MNKIKINTFLVTICILLLGVTSCEEDTNYITKGKYRFERAFSGNNLDIKLDGTPLQHVTVDMSVKNMNVIIKLTDFLGNNSTITWQTPFDPDNYDFIFKGTYTLPNGQMIQYTVSFDNFLDSDKMLCKIVCETLN